MSSKRDCLCQHCGVVELRGFCATPDGDGAYNRSDAEHPYDILDGEMVMLYV